VNRCIPLNICNPSSLISVVFPLLQVGALVEGVVRRIEPFGVFVGIKGTRISGLLHVSNISRLHVDNPGVRSLKIFGKCFLLCLKYFLCPLIC
jgi:transcriptional accessory protein Tex/SPT6